MRKLGFTDDAQKEINALLERDPLNHFSRFEKYLQNPSPENGNLVKQYITNELPQETYLEYALWYYKNNQLADALKVLDLAPKDHPMVLLWKAYINHLIKNEEVIVKEMLSKALNADSKFVLPFRIESLNPLNWAGTLSDNWKINYYKGLIYLSIGATDKAKSLWASLNQEPDFYPFYFARCDLGGNQAQADISRALMLSGDDWQAGLKASKYYLRKGNTQKAEELASKYYNNNPSNFNLGLQYAKALEENKKYLQSVSILKNIQMLPGEGSSESRKLWRDANLGYARNLMETGKYKKALNYIESARKWPINLGVGKPYLSDETTEDNLALECYKKLKNEKLRILTEDKLRKAISTVKQ